MVKEWSRRRQIVVVKEKTACANQAWVKEWSRRRQIVAMCQACGGFDLRGHGIGIQAEDVGRLDVSADGVMGREVIVQREGIVEGRNHRGGWEKGR